MENLLESFLENNRKKLCDKLKAARSELGDMMTCTDLLHVSQSHISNIENGRRRPNELYLTRLARATKVSYIEEALWLGMAGYLPLTRMPSADQIKAELDIYCEHIKKDWYASVIVDYRFGIWAMNAAGRAILGEDVTRAKMEQYVTVLDMLFSDYLLREGTPIKYKVTNNLSATQQVQIILFKIFNVNRRHEPFFEYWLSYMEDRLGKDSVGFQEFEQAWQLIDIADDMKGNRRLKQGIVEVSGLPSMESDIAIRFRQRLEPIYHLPQFAIMRFEPQITDQPQYNELIQPQNDKVMRLWEIRDVDEILKMYNRENLISPEFTD